MDINSIIGSMIGKTLVVAAFILIFFIVRFIYNLVLKLRSDTTIVSNENTVDTKGNIVSLLIAISIILAWFFRYDIYPNATGNGPSAYVLDRWTGNITLLYGLKVIEAPPNQK